jgi:hypothetical protein
MCENKSSCIFKNKALDKIPRASFHQIPEATDRKTVFLIVVVSVYVVIVVVQIAVPSIVCIVLRRTPPVTVVTNVVEITIVVTVTARKT